MKNENIFKKFVRNKVYIVLPNKLKPQISEN